MSFFTPSTFSAVSDGGDEKKKKVKIVMQQSKKTMMHASFPDF